MIDSLMVLTRIPRQFDRIIYINRKPCDKLARKKFYMLRMVSEALALVCLKLTALSAER